MEQPLWKRILSYFKEIEIETTQSVHNPSLRVVLRKGQYQLNTANAIYSYGLRYDNFTEAFEQIDLDALEIESVLILGFGLGSIPMMLERIFKKKYAYTAVEIDEEILRLAKKYVTYNLNSSLLFSLGDAQAYVTHNRRKFEMICMDVFLDDAVPSQLEQDDFLLDLKRMLTNDGILLFNKLSYHRNDKQQTLSFYQNHFKRIFPEGGYLDVRGNYILLNRMDCLKA